MSSFLHLFSDTANQTANLVTCHAAGTCSFCSLMAMINGLVEWLIIILTLFSILIIAYAGFLLVFSRGDRSALETGKKLFFNSIIGILIMLAGWTIVDTTIKLIAGGSLGMWNEVQCGAGEFEAGSATYAITLSQEEFDAMVSVETEEYASIMSLGPAPGTGGSNCGVNEAALVPLPGFPQHRATADTANRFLAMSNEAARQGISLAVTSSYRSDARQTQLWDQCPVCQREGTVARPCSRGGNGSRHSSGVALDLSSSGSRCQVINLCRAAGASFIMTYSRSGHVHCDWGGRPGESLTISWPR